MAKRNARTRTTQARGVFSPEQLTEWLDRWALRREKVLRLLDIRAAQKARRLARRCETIGQLRISMPGDGWEQRWHLLRLEVASFLRANNDDDSVEAEAQRPQKDA